MTLAVQAGETAKHRHTYAIWSHEEISARNSADFQRWVKRELRGNFTKMSIDMRKVNYVDAPGLAAIMRVSRLANFRGIEIEWLNLGTNVAKVIALTKLDSILNVR